MTRRLFTNRDSYMLAKNAELRDHADERLREALYEIERNEDLLQRAKKRWMYDQARRAGVDADEPATRAGLSWAWRKTAIAQDIIGDIQLWKSRLEVYSAVLGGVDKPVNMTQGITGGIHMAPGQGGYGI